MATLSGIPYFEVQFDKRGGVHDATEEAALSDFLVQHAEVRDLIVISHGWNNNIAEARALYGDVFGRFRAVIDQGVVAGADRPMAILGVLWPSKKFTSKHLIPSGAANLGSAIDDSTVEAELDELVGVFDLADADARLAEARTLVIDLDDRQSARTRFSELVRSLIEDEDEDESEEDQLSRALFDTPADEILDRLARPTPLPASTGAIGGAAAVGGGAAGLGNLFSGFKAGALKLLNYVTYYKMKKRAGIVGRDGVNPLLGRLRGVRNDLRFQLVGHSFGGRLVAAAALGSPGGGIPIHSLTLLQAAFSHFGFSENWDDSGSAGFFQPATANMAGPILISHTVNDTAVGIMYPIASSLANQVAAGLGDENDPFGGIGRNGAQKTGNTVPGTLRPVGDPYPELGTRKFYNLRADDTIMEHSDIAKDEVAYAVLSAVTTS